MTSQTVRVLLIEENRVDADLIAAHLERCGEGRPVVLERVGSAAAFAQGLLDFNPDVILIGQAPAELNAKAALELIRDARSTAPLIVVAATFDEESAVASLRAGAEDFVLKKNLSRLSRSIAAAIEGRQNIGKLSPRQREVLRLVAEGHTTREIAQQLKLSAKTVETHRGAVMKRLDIHDLVGLVRYALRVGLVSPDA